MTLVQLRQFRDSRLTFSSNERSVFEIDFPLLLLDFCSGEEGQLESGDNGSFLTQISSMSISSDELESLFLNLTLLHLGDIEFERTFIDKGMDIGFKRWVFSICPLGNRRLFKCLEVFDDKIGFRLLLIADFMEIAG